MRWLIVIASILLVGCANLVAVNDEPTLTICNGPFALCAASTCEPTGKIMYADDGKLYPEMKCTCPVLNGASIADLSAGQMKGSCDVEDPNKQVWSLFAPHVYYPQEASDFVQTPKSAMRATVQNCPGELAPESVNCFGFMCTYEEDPINGTTVATCKCPSRQIEKGTDFLIEAGQGDPTYCAKHPVSAPNPFVSN